ncbi:hypothetical protein GQ457_14G002300 [Hibiscus cannabinus]
MEGVLESTKVRTVMLNLEDKALQWHHFVVRSHGGIDNLNWENYIKLRKDRFAPNRLEDLMGELVTLKQTAYVDQYYAKFVSLLNQIQLFDDYALSIFIKNLKWEVGQYIRVFQPKDLLDAFKLVIHFQQIIFLNPKKSFVPLVRSQSTSLPFTPPTYSRSGSSTNFKSSSGTIISPVYARNSIQVSISIKVRIVTGEVSRIVDGSTGVGGAGGRVEQGCR